MLRGCKCVAFYRADACSPMDKEEVLRERSEIAGIVVHSVFRYIEESVFELCFHMLRDETLNHLLLAFCGRTDNQIFLSLRSENRVREAPS